MERAGLRGVWKISAQPHTEHRRGWEVEAEAAIPSRQAGTPVPGTHPPAGWGRLGISCQLLKAALAG